jgi:hypothetical protein
LPDCGNWLWADDFHTALSIEFWERESIDNGANIGAFMRDNSEDSRQYIRQRKIAEHYWFVFPGQYEYWFENGRKRLKEASKGQAISRKLASEAPMVQRFEWLMPSGIHEILSLTFDAAEVDDEQRARPGRGYAWFELPGPDAPEEGSEFARPARTVAAEEKAALKRPSSGKQIDFGFSQEVPVEKVALKRAFPSQPSAINNQVAAPPGFALNAQQLQANKAALAQVIPAAPPGLPLTTSQLQANKSALAQILPNHGHTMTCAPPGFTLTPQ